MFDNRKKSMNAELDLRKGERFSKITFWLLGILLVTVFIFAFLFYFKLRNDLTSEAHQNLINISNQKSNQIKNWLNNQYLAADYFYNNTLFEKNLEKIINNSGDAGLKKDMAQVFYEICDKFAFFSIRLFDTNNKLVFSNAQNAKPLGEFLRETLNELKIHPKIFLTDFHFYEKSDTIHLDLIMPIVNRSNNILLGFLCLEVNPNTFLFPVIQEWPSYSKTSECLIIKNDNGDALFLNNLRFLQNSALRLKIDKSMSDMIAIKAVNGARDIVEGKDYRGVQAIAYVQTIAGTNWIMIVKIDSDEIFADVNASAGLFSFMMLFSVALIGWIIITNYKRIERINKSNMIKLEAEKQFLSANYNMFIENTNDIIILSDLNGKITEINNNALNTYGYSSDEFMNMNIKDISPEYLKHSHKVRETYHLKKDGTIFPVEISSKSIKLNGRAFIQNFIRDITERTQAQKRIYHLNIVYSILSQINENIVRTKDRNELFKKFVDIAIDYGKFSASWIGIIEKDSGRIKPLFLRGSGIENYYELMKNMIYNYVHLENPTKKAVETKSVVICNNINEEVSEIKIKFFNETNNFQSEVSIPLIFRDKVIGVYNIIHTETNYFMEDEISLMEDIKNDISFALEAIQVEIERKTTADDLRKSENRFKTIFENASDSVIILQGYKIIDLNLQAENMLGFTRDELIDASVFSFVIDTDIKKINLKEILGKAIKGIPQRILLRVMRKGGHIIQADISLNLITIGSSNMTILIVRDVTERLKIEEELIDAKNMAEEMNQLKTNFLANMSHELRTPLNGIMGFSEMLIEQTKDEDQKNISSAILSSSRRLLNTLNNILNLALIEGDKVTIKLKKIKLSDVIIESVKSCQTIANAKNLKLSYEINNESYSMLDVDLLKNILSNLINNAVTFTDKGSVTVTLNEIKENDKPFSVIKIKDTGIGIKEDIFSTIFEPFRQASEGLARKYEGIGIGLTISKKYIDRMKGTITVESEEGKGSTFTLKFPALESGNNFAEEKLPQDIISKVPSDKSIKVLIVEDDEYSLNYAKAVLRNICEIEEAYLGKDAIDKARIKNYDLILMDIRLPDMNGLDAVKEIRSSGLNRNTAIATITAFSFQNDEIIHEGGCDFYLEKPYKIEDLKSLVYKSVSAQKTK